MLFPDTIEVAAGLVFVYLFISVLATIARETWEGFVKSRSRTLERGLIELLCDTAVDTGAKKGTVAANSADRHGRYEILKEFYDHPLIMSLYRGRYTPPSKRSSFTQARQLPSYIPSGHFAFTVLDLLSRKGGQTRVGILDADEILKAAEAMPTSRLAQIAQFAIHNSGGDLEQARQFLETWFNATMDRVSGWYKHETQTIIFWVSLVACVVLNVNTVVIADSLYRDPTLRKVAVTKAEAYINQNATIPAADNVKASNPAPVTTAMPKVISVEEAANLKAVDSAAVTDPAVVSDVPPVADAPAPAPAAPVVSQGPIQSDTSGIASKLVKDVENVKDRRDALADIGLPLGWNNQTLMTMRRLFSFQTAPQEPVKVFEEKNSTGSKPRGLFPDLARWGDNVMGAFKSFINDAVAYYNGQPLLGDAFLINVVTAISLIGGWVMTALAVTLGAPFWFDVLSKLMIVRSTIKPKDGSPGQGGLDGLGALATALSVTSPGYVGGYTPRLVARPADAKAVASSAATSVPTTTQDDDLLFLRGLDPYDRPRED